MARSPL